LLLSYLKNYNNTKKPSKKGLRLVGFKREFGFGPTHFSLGGSKFMSRDWFIELK